MSPATRTVPRFLHLHSTFARGGKERRAVQLMNAFGPGIAHTIVSGERGQTTAGAEISNALAIDFPADFPSLTGRPTPNRLRRLAEAMRGYDLILTYNWGAMDMVMAHTLFGQHYGLAPLVHHGETIDITLNVWRQEGPNRSGASCAALTLSARDRAQSPFCAKMLLRKP